MNRKCFVLIFILTLIMTPVFANFNDTYKVIKVIDGDTVYLRVSERQGKRSLSLSERMRGIAKQKLLNKEVITLYSAEEKTDKNNRKLMSIYYDCKTPPNIRPSGINLLYLPHRSEPSSCCYPKKKFIKFKKTYKTYTKQATPDIKDGALELYFLSPLKQKKPQNACKSSACKALLYNIDNVKESIDFAIYGISEQDKIFNALVNAQKRGIKIRWVTDLTENKENIYGDTYNLMKQIPSYKTDYESAESIKIPDYNYKLAFQGALMHDKFFIFDKKIVFTGSTNISSTCLTGFNSNVAIIINSQQIANLYEQEFEQMYNGKFHGEKQIIKNNEDIILDNKNVSVYFSPMNKISTTKIIPLIKTAKTYIYVPAFYLTHRGIIEELINAKKRGIDIKIIVDQTSVEGKFVNVDYIKQSGVDVKVENWAGKMHMKSMIIDDNTLVIGSMNFTKQGEKLNDENSIIIKNSPILTTAYKAHFLKLWNSIR